MMDGAYRFWITLHQCYLLVDQTITVLLLKTFIRHKKCDPSQAYLLLWVQWSILRSDR